MVTYGTENISCATVQTLKTQIFVGNTAFRAHILHTGQSRHECYPAVRQEPLAQLSGRAEESYIAGNEQSCVLFCALVIARSASSENAQTSALGDSAASRFVANTASAVSNARTASPVSVSAVPMPAPMMVNMPLALFPVP